jgi:hypothetical protein
MVGRTSSQKFVDKEAALDCLVVVGRTERFGALSNTGFGFGLLSLKIDIVCRPQCHVGLITVQRSIDSRHVGIL